MDKSPFPERNPLIPRWSPSRIEEYLLCGELYRQRRIERVRRIMVYTAIGKGVHKAAGADNRSKKDHGVQIPLKEAIEISVHEYEESFKDAEVIESKEEISKGKDLAATGASAFKEIVSPSIESPGSVEAPILARFQGIRGIIEISGILDLCDKVGSRSRIRDFKTGKIRKREDYAHGRGQLTAYGILHQAQYSSWPDIYQVDSLWYTKRQGWQYEPIQTDRDEEDYASYWKRVLTVNAAVQAGSFPPAPEGSWICSPNFCEFFSTCDYVASRRRHLSHYEEE